MILNSHLFNKDTLNIFTDASIIKYPDGETVGCAGAHIITGSDPVNNILEQPRTIIRNTTNNNSEIKAILLGIQRALVYRNRYKTINLISDSKICIYGLREWVFNWVNDSVNSDVLIGSQGDPVANQDVILQIIYTIINNGLVINLYHQKGHVRDSEKSLTEAKNTFINSNHIQDDIDIELIKNISIANNIVDNFTRETLKSYPRIPQPVPINNLVSFTYNGFDTNRYKELLNII